MTEYNPINGGYYGKMLAFSNTFSWLAKKLVAWYTEEKIKHHSN
jgi:hypothetical protein